MKLNDSFSSFVCLFYCSLVPETTQIIGMSATLGNIKDIQKFLRAENYTNDFRPVCHFSLCSQM